MQKAFVFILSIILLSSFAGCEKTLPDGTTEKFNLGEELKDVGDKILGNTNDEKEVIFQQEAKPENTNTHNFEEEFIYNDFAHELSLNCKKVTRFKTLEEAGIDLNDMPEFNKEIKLDENSKMHPDCSFLLFEIEVKNTKTVNERDLIADFYLHFPDLDMSALTSTYGLPDYPDYFYFEQTETATRSQSSSGYYHFSLPENESATIYLGYVILNDLIDNYQGMLKFGVGNMDIQYVSFDLNSGDNNG